MSTLGPVEERYAEKMSAVAHLVHDVFNPAAAERGSAGNTGWCLLVFPFGEAEEGQARMSFASNANKEDLIKALEELVSRMKGEHPEERTVVR